MKFNLENIIMKIVHIVQFKKSLINQIKLEKSLVLINNHIIIVFNVINNKVYQLKLHHNKRFN